LPPNTPSANKAKESVKGYQPHLGTEFGEFVMETWEVGWRDCKGAIHDILDITMLHDL
jgi:hypothetical protein